MDKILLNAILNGNVHLDFSTLVVIYTMLEESESQEELGPLFDLSVTSDTFCLENFRFRKADILALKEAIGISDVLRRSRHVKFSGLEGLCVLLRRLAYPNRLCDLKRIFKRKENILSMMISTMLETIIDMHGHLLKTVGKWWMDDENLLIFASAIHGQGAPLTNCVGFVDSTVRAICRPGRYQREVYNGPKRKHALKFQSVVVPNGLVSKLFGPISGRRHDSYMLRESNLLRDMEREIPGFCIYGDPAYPHCPQLQAPYKGAHLSQEQLEFNSGMSMNRVVVEWAFGKVISLFAFLDFKKNLKLYLQPVSKLYTVGVILTNCHTCLYGSQTTSKFNVNPPSLFEYINGPT